MLFQVDDNGADRGIEIGVHVQTAGRFAERGPEVDGNGPINHSCTFAQLTDIAVSLGQGPEKEEFPGRE